MRIRGRSRFELLDRLLGIPLLRMLSLFPAHPRVDPSTVRRIGLLKAMAVGDTLLLAGPIDDLRLKFPSAELVLITDRENGEPGALLAGRVDRVVVVSRRRFFGTIRALRRERFDALLDFATWPRLDALFVALSRARMRVGFETRGRSRHHAYDAVVEHSVDVHELDNYRRLISVLGVHGQTEPRIEASGSVPRDQLPSAPFVVFHPWADQYRGELREWSLSSWVELGTRMHRRGWEIVIAGPDAFTESARVIESALESFGCRAHNVTGRYTQSELTAVLAASEAVVTVDNEVMHLAAMLGARTISLHGPTSARRWGPLGRRAHAVKSPLPEYGFLAIGFENGDDQVDCMSGITPDMVDAAVGKALPSRGARV